MIATPAGGIRLNVGCGRHVLDGWVNVDLVADPDASRAPELLCSVGKIPLDDGCAFEVMGIHIWEHLYLWECDDVLAEWHRLLRPKGKLILEMPDLFKFCKNILDGRAGRGHPDQLGMWGLYGDPRPHNPLMMHRWGWTYSTLAPFLEAHGFTHCIEKPTEWHNAGSLYRDFRIEAVRA